MTFELDIAKSDAVSLATRLGIAHYIYRLNSGHYYISATPPTAINAQYVATARSTIPGTPARILR